MILDDIVENTKDRIKHNQKSHSIEKLKEEAFQMEISNDFPFEKALRKNNLAYILELKKNCPKKGQIVSNFDFKSIAKEYELIGADAIAVETEPDYYKGDDDFLTEISKIVGVPVLRRDFILDEYMVYESKIIGADAINLLAGIMDEITLMRCMNLATNLGMSSVIECHSSMQVKKALRVGAKIIAVNNIDMRDYSVDLNNSLELRDLVDKDVIFIAQGGIKAREDIIKIENKNINAVIVGEVMLTSHGKKRTLEILKGLREDNDD
ncbi:MAG: indole-3-glycerol phosphate synthase TrpC [Thomasclavelia sp.]|nr:indole-3-glycerol phosphate synthase TrpC [Thomasclavelia sp.]